MYAIRSYYGFLERDEAPEVAVAREVKEETVITSYSIHYTKLYEPDWEAPIVVRHRPVVVNVGERRGRTGNECLHRGTPAMSGA